METIKLMLPGENDFFVEEAYKVFRTNLQFCGQDVKVIEITSCHENEGKSTVALSVGKSFASLGKKVLVIDADMRKSVMAGRNTNVLNPSGLSEVLTGIKTLEDCLYNVEGTSMYLLFAGKYPPNPVELLDGKYFTRLIEKCRQEFDYVLVDTAPLGLVIDAAVIAPVCDGTVLVLGSNHISYKTAQDVVEQINKSGSKMLGVVRNSSRKTGGGYYRSKYGKYGKYSKYSRYSRYGRYGYGKYSNHVSDKKSRVEETHQE